MPDMQTVEARLAAVREDQLARWQRGDRVRVEFYLDRDPELAAATDAALDLIYSEVLLHEEFGQALDVADYLRRFPQHAAALWRQLALHSALSSSDAEDDPARTTLATGPETLL